MFKRVLPTLCRYMFIGIIFPFLVQYVIYYRFTPNYNVNAFSEAHFTEGSNKGVFRYRLLGREMHLWLFKKLSMIPGMRNMKENPLYEKRLDYLDADADYTFYFTYFLIALLFSILTSVFLLLIFDSGPFFKMSEPQKIFIPSFLILFIGLTNFVITPYDNLSYFFLTLAIFSFLKYLYSSKWIHYSLVCMVILLATLNRESSLLILSFMAGIYISVYKIQDLRWIRKMIVPVFCFIIPYVALRYFLGGDPEVSAGSFLLDNLSIFKISKLSGFLFVPVFFYMLWHMTNSRENRRLIINFLMMASPYIVIIPVIGILIEYRLWVPVLIPVIVLSRLDAREFLARIKPV
jgi:hypothetical protein